MKKYFVIIIYLLLSSCASQGYPGGGAIDEQGPGVLEFKPNSEIISKTQTISIVFDEMVDNSCVMESININQSDDFQVRTKYNKVMLTPNNEWDDIIEIVLLRGICDYQKNIMAL